MRAGLPDWTIWDAAGECQATCRDVEAATVLVGFYGRGATIRFDGVTVWHEGREQVSATGYTSVCADLCVARRDDAMKNAYIERFGQAAYDKALRLSGVPQNLTGGSLLDGRPPAND